jgi:L-ribulokinase
MTQAPHVIGLDYGTDSVRAVLINAKNGEVQAEKVHWYQRWKQGLYCNPVKNQFRQHPLDHIEGVEHIIKSIVKEINHNNIYINGICIDTTGSSPLPVDANGTALALIPGFESDPNAMMVLWKDHTAVKEADEINELARTWGGEDFTKYEGGIYSSEWFWAKILHVIREDPEIKKAAFSWLEHCDYMTYLLVGGALNDLKRSRCAAGHKAMWHHSWGGLPDDEFLSLLDPYLVTLKENLYSDTFTSEVPAGTLCQEWAERLGLSTDVVVSVGTFDAHAGAVGAEVEEFTLVRVMGTSTCDIIVSSPDATGDKTVKGICGQVDGSVIPGMIGLEAGQSAFGDLLAWFRDLLAWPLDNLELNLSHDQLEKLKQEMIARLSRQAEQLPVDDAVPVALDWINGRRTPDANQSLKSGIVNLSLGSDAPQVFRSLVAAICFGSRKIIERFAQEGVEIRSVVGIGGVAKKSPYIMQTLADVLQMPIKIARSEQAPALGAAMYAAVAAGIYATVEEAIKNMGNGFEVTYHPDAELSEHYSKLYKKYNSLGDFVEKLTDNNSV